MAMVKKYYWPNMSQYIENYISKCQICLTMKTERHPQHVEFKRTETPSKPFELINIDTQVINGQNIVTIIEVFSKYAHAYSVDTISGMTVQKALLKFIESHGYPYKILVDIGIEFNNIMMKDFCQLHKIQLIFTSVHGHTSNGNIERFHSTFLDLLRCIQKENPSVPIDYLLHLAIIADKPYNTL